MSGASNEPADCISYTNSQLIFQINKIPILFTYPTMLLYLCKMAASVIVVAMMTFFVRAGYSTQESSNGVLESDEEAILFESILAAITNNRGSPIESGSKVAEVVDIQEIQVNMVVYLGTGVRSLGFISTPRS